jgi:hypothetical protein
MWDGLLLEKLSEPLGEASIPVYWLSVLSVTSGGLAFFGISLPQNNPDQIRHLGMVEWLTLCG